MKNVVLKTLSLINFRGQKDRTIDFSVETTICGDNATGKSTIFDAFIWLLFGKDQFDRKDFEIIPIENGKRLDRVDAEVSAIVEVEGQEMKLKRVLHQKWVRRRGTSEEVFDGCDTLYYVNDVPLKAGEYKSRIDAIIDEAVFKMITNPAFFLSLKWQDQRAHLFQIAGTVSDEQIAASNPDFRILLDLITGKSMSDYKKEISSRKKKLNEDLKMIPAKIDQTRRLMPENKDFEAISVELQSIDQEINTLDQQISDKSAAVRSQYEGVQAKQNEINSLKSQQQNVVFAAKNKAQDDVFKSNANRRELENSIQVENRNAENSRRAKIDSQRAVDNLKGQIKDTNEKIDSLRQRWYDENAKEYTAKEGCLVCPVFGSTCGDPAAIGKHEEAQEKAKKAFFETREKNLAKIDQEGESLSKTLENLTNQLEASEKNLRDHITAIEESESQICRLQDQLNQTPVATVSPVVAEELPEWQAIEKRIAEIKASIQEVKPVDVSDLQSQKKVLVEKRDALKAQLSDKDLIVKYNREIKVLEEESKKLSQQIADIEKQEFTIADFTKAKIDECDRRINGLFSIVKFQLFDRTIDGNEFEACIATNNAGVPIASTNTAEKINAGLDIINALCRFHNVTAPIFIDGRESVNRLIETNSQIINLVVTTDKSLLIK